MASTNHRMGSGLERKIKEKIGVYLKKMKRIKQIKEGPEITEMNRLDNERKSLEKELVSAAVENAEKVEEGKNGDKVYFLTVGKRQLKATLGTRNGYTVASGEKKDLKVIEL